MKVHVIKDYPDKDLRRTVKKDEVLDVSDARADVLIKAGVAETTKRGLMEEKE